MSSEHVKPSAEPEKPTCPWCERYTDRHMDAYYYGFEATGQVLIDNILCSVAAAGKGAHHTEDWGELGYVDRIQRAARAAGEEIFSLQSRLTAAESSLAEARARVAELEKHRFVECPACENGFRASALMECEGCGDWLCRDCAAPSPNFGKVVCASCAEDSQRG